MDHTLAVTKALSDRNRLRTFMALLHFGELCVCEITELLQVTAPTVSRHMAILSGSGLVTSRKEGRWVYYRPCEEGSKDSDKEVVGWLETRLAAAPEIASDRKRLQIIIHENRRSSSCNTGESRHG
ncbi:hypothetical protein DSLASN_30160 [Desulfoluna limicola]|uniref:HTH arsR-type domain-containing protein n=1 Tax=Desulfoluna limicola TaxID=2810562 RepID=A0ABM7PII5_9BACT|nr:metalloregulator ArsR/SmtB family transcription factor [Desulfoluna limicola]BCS97384.1 hypothetical protein DSLASN_30160 [Desulfoluna limicola]